MLSTEQRSFDNFYLSGETRQALTKVNYREPTRVQAEAIPLILAGIDLTLQSQTGSGKTGAFAIPIIEMLEPKAGRIDVLVVTPTRELAKQVCDEFEGLGEFKDIRATAIYGGTSYEKQYEALAKSNVVVATPGRLLDLCEKKKLDLSELRILVLDEADEMLSMGFRDDIEAVMAYLPEERQSILCSATFTEEIKALANKILFYPEFITLSAESVGATDVTHCYYNVRGVGRPRDLLKVLEYEEPESAIIFANTKNDTFAVTAFLKRHGYRADVLNGDLPQKEREKTLRDLRDSNIDFIVATDVAARGIDISDLTHVVNYALPDSAEVYIHRTGRTGRAGKKGKAISLIAPTEVGTFFQVRKLYDVKLQELPLPTTKDIMIARQRRALGDLASKLEKVDTLAYGAYLRMAEDLVAGAPSLKEDHDPVKLAARLLALAELYLEGKAPVAAVAERPAAAQTVAPVVQEESRPTREAPQETAEPAVEAPAASDSEEIEAPRETSAEEEEPSPEKVETKGSPRRARRSSRTSRSEERSASAEEPKIEATKESSEPEPKRRRRTRKETPSPVEPEITTVAPNIEPPKDTRKMYLNVGKDSFESASTLVEMICFLSGMDPEDFGTINLESSYSFVHVRRDYFSDVVAALNGAKWEGTQITAEPARK